MICTQCYSQGEPKKQKRGYSAVTWILLGFTLLVVAFQLLDHYAEVDSFRSNYREYAAGRYETPVALQVMGAVGLWGWIIHVIFRAATKRRVCPRCGAANAMVPDESPRGRELLASSDRGEQS